MSVTQVFLILGSLLATAALWTAPRGMGQNLVAAITATLLFIAAPVSALWLLASVVLTPMAMHLGERLDRKGLIVVLCTALLGGVLIASRDFEAWSGQAIALLGGAYFTLRHIHVLMEWWMGRIGIPTIPAYARYQLFLPVLLAGPIHRLPHFERQCARRRFDADELFMGAERALIGVFLAVVVGDFLFAHFQRAVTPALAILPSFFRTWLSSVIEWGRLYIQFSGFTDLALGLSLMMGLRLEENFDRPWGARDLIDFWNRWHMTLSRWCRDYVYVPISAHFRAPVVGLVAAMLVMGAWHETSGYYVVWALWQALGILLTRIYANAGDPMRIGKLGPTALAVLAPFSILAWLSAARPVAQVILGMSVE